ncbi:O-antigen polymerase [Aureliella helgolandensis]|uniref:Oligosaccharide repeat unit polymerase n=1 Tax=Aureliella helgolandensis TaxID=2527968 RepID=A0A518G804_9BACT|nr:O-antigen polymerase [Aureliella helgolandensis]QDV24717.1 hypothetical protein Q31a_30380 [Aureliella helgolandensis]
MNPKLNSLWWLRPSWLYFLAVGGTLLVAYLQREHDYVLYGTPKYFDFNHLLLGLGAVAVFLLGCQLGHATGKTSSGLNPTSDPVLKRCFWGLFSLSCFGYMVWLAIGIGRGFSLAMLPDLLFGEDVQVDATIREAYFGTIPGITTCSQFSLAAVPIGMWLYLRGHQHLLWPLTALLGIAFARAILLGERLAFIEILLPMCILYFQQKVVGRQYSPPVHSFLQALPILAVLGLLSFFAISESFRSWKYYEDEFDSIAEFTLWRVGGYYTAAHNNGVMASRLNVQLPLPYSTFYSLWNFPGVADSPISYSKLTGVDPDRVFEDLLHNYATPELNNGGGVFQPLLDFGTAGFLVFWTFCGFASGRLYRGFTANTIAGICFYPLVVIAILETPRLLYFSSTRTFPGIVALLAVVWIVEYRSATLSRASAQPLE